VKITKLTKFLERHDEHPATKDSYKISLNQFFKWKQTNADKYIVDIRKLSPKKKQEAIDRYKQDIEDYWKHLTQKYKPKYTRSVKLNAIRQLLIEYEIELPIVFWKRLKSSKEKGQRAATQDRIPTRHELRKIILEGKPIARTMFLLASCTGCRIGELTQLKLTDIPNLNNNPIWIMLPGEITKTGDPRTVFVSDETAVYLRKWVNEDREEYLKNIKHRMNQMSTHEKYKHFSKKHQTDDGRLFPISRQTAESYWQLMLKRANLDQRDTTTNMRVLHCHVLRKWFRTMMGKPMGIDACETVLGHSGYLTNEYRKIPEDELARIYYANQEYITVIQEPKSLEKLDSDLTGLKNDFQKIMNKWLITKDENETLRKENEELKKKR